MPDPTEPPGAPVQHPDSVRSGRIPDTLELLRGEPVDQDNSWFKHTAKIGPQEQSYGGVKEKSYGGGSQEKTYGGGYGFEHHGLPIMHSSREQIQPGSVPIVNIPVTQGLEDVKSQSCVEPEKNTQPCDHNLKAGHPLHPAATCKTLQCCDTLFPSRSSTQSPSTSPSASTSSSTVSLSTKPSGCEESRHTYQCLGRSRNDVSAKHSYYDCCVHVAVPSLLDHWLDGDIAHSQPVPSLPQPSLHLAALMPHPGPWLQQLLAKPGCDPNIRNHEEQTALHCLILGWDKPSQNSQHLLESIKLLVLAGDNPGATDQHRDSSLTLVRHLLERGNFELAADVASLLIKHGADVNHVNSLGRNLLSYSLSHLDHSLLLTKLLFNLGGWDWSNQDSQFSPFSVLLRSIMREQSLENATETLDCVGQLMSESANRMKQLVISSMVREGRATRVMGPLFQEIKARMAVHWTSPGPLRQLCWTKIRRAVGVKRLGSGGIKTLKLPSRIIDYLNMDSVNVNTLNKPKTSHTVTQKTETGEHLHQDRISYKIRMELLSNTKTI